MRLIAIANICNDKITVGLKRILPNKSNGFNLIEKPLTLQEIKKTVK